MWAEIPRGRGERELKLDAVHRSSCRKDWKETSAESSLRSPSTTQSVQELNWTEQMVVAFSLLARILGECLTIQSAPVLFLKNIFLKWRLFAHTYSTLQARISPQWLSERRRLCPSVPWRVACELASKSVPTLCQDSGIVSPLRLIAEARKRPRSFCQKRRRQVTPTHGPVIAADGKRETRSMGHTAPTCQRSLIDSWYLTFNA